MRRLPDSNALSLDSSKSNLTSHQTSLPLQHTTAQQDSLDHQFQLSTQDQEQISIDQFRDMAYKAARRALAPLQDSIRQLRTDIAFYFSELGKEVNKLRMKITEQNIEIKKTRPLLAQTNSRLGRLQQVISIRADQHTFPVQLTKNIAKNSYSSIGSTNFHFGRQLHYPTFYKWAKKVEARRFGLHGDKNDNPTYLTTNLYEAETRSPMRFPYEPERLSSLGFGRKQNSEAYQDSSRSGASRHRS